MNNTLKRQNLTALSLKLFFYCPEQRLIAETSATIKQREYGYILSCVFANKYKCFWSKIKSTIFSFFAKALFATILHDTLKMSRNVMSNFFFRCCNFSEWGDEDSLSQRSCGFWQSSWSAGQQISVPRIQLQHSLRRWGESAFKLLQTWYVNNPIDTKDYAFFYRWNWHRQIYINEHTI